MVGLARPRLKPPMPIATDRTNAMLVKRVEIVIGGVQKAGTTSLFRYLQAHPALLAPLRAKELHFFDDEALDWSEPNYELLHGAFGDAGANRKAYEATPIYLFWPPSLQRIHSYNPKMKLIFLFRIQSSGRGPTGKWKSIDGARRCHSMSRSAGVASGCRTVGRLTGHGVCSAMLSGGYILTRSTTPFGCSRATSSCFSAPTI
jgi:hypothetical protein